MCMTIFALGGKICFSEPMEAMLLRMFLQKYFEKCNGPLFSAAWTKWGGIRPHLILLFILSPNSVNYEFCCLLCLFLHRPLLFSHPLIVDTLKGFILYPLLCVLILDDDLILSQTLVWLCINGSHGSIPSHSVSIYEAPNCLPDSSTSQHLKLLSKYNVTFSLSFIFTLNSSWSSLSSLSLWKVLASWI